MCVKAFSLHHSPHTMPPSRVCDSLWVPNSLLRMATNESEVCGVGEGSVMLRSPGG